jgi:HAD superfamily hydrolase (TIGR01509 family)
LQISDYQAIIFDLDGVLANSEPAIFRIHQDVLRQKYQRVMAPEDYHDLFGLDYYDSASFLIRKYAIQTTPQELAEDLHRTVVQEIAQVIEPISGAQELVKRITHHHIPTGLASNSPSDYVIRVVAALGLSAYFPAPVCRDDVKNGKPAPDPYLEACRRVQADPFHCLAVEDSPVGLQAALSAGMYCALVGPVDPQSQSPKIHRFANIGALQSALLD